MARPFETLCRMMGTGWWSRVLTLQGGLLTVVLAGIVLLLPSRLGSYDGGPLDSRPELGLVVLIVPLFISRSLRERSAAALGRVGRRLRSVHWEAQSP
jgi:hypothetical protein